MINKPLISVLVAVYNTEYYLEDCLESIINQTYKNIEIILVNDGSTDNSLDICEYYAKKDFRIKIINQENMGLAKTRNIGLNNMNGEFFTFFDSDDIMATNFIETMHKSIKDDVDIVCMNFKNIKENVHYSNVKDKLVSNDIENLKYNSKEAFIKLSYCEDFLISSHGKLFRTKKLGHIRFKSYFHEDLGNIYKFFLNSDKIVKVEGEGYYYRIRKGSMINSKFTKEKENIINLADDMLNDIKDKSILPYANLLLFSNFVYNYKEHIELFNSVRKKFRVKISEFSEGAKDIRKEYKILEEYRKHPVYSLEKIVIKNFFKKFLKNFYYNLKNIF